MTFVHAIILLSLLSFACGRIAPGIPDAAFVDGGLNTGPKSDGDLQPAEEETSDPVPVPVPSMDGDSGPAPEDTKPCPEKSNVTVSKALSENFVASGEALILSFELQLQDCKGATLPIQDQVLAFDIRSPVFADSWDFEVLDSSGSKSLLSGPFNKKGGFDIFGPRKNYFLLQTPALALNSSENKVTLVVKIGKFRSNGPFPAKVETYQRIGDSTPKLVLLNTVE